MWGREMLRSPKQISAPTSMIPASLKSRPFERPMTQLGRRQHSHKTRTDDPGCDDDACKMHGGGCEIVAVHGDVAQPYTIVAQLVGALYNLSPIYPSSVLRRVSLSYSTLPVL